MDKKYIAYLHACGLSQLELTNIFSWDENPRDFFDYLSHENLEKFVSSRDRRGKILENYFQLKTQYIDSVIEKLGVDIIILWESNYPESLKNIPHTPYVLYVRGKIPEWDMFWVVWSRKISEYGKKVIQNIVPDVSRIFPVVSGWAAGCDTYAHRACIDSWNSTVVVVWTGIDQTYPVSNEKLFTSVAESSGAIISIFRIWEPGNPYNFPVRNEIVVWLSRGILVVEAQEKSGSLITAWLALDLWKDLFSVPWDILSPNYIGTNNLIKRWEAKCVLQSADILEEYDIAIKQIKHKDVLVFSDSLEEVIYNSLSTHCANIDLLSQRLGIDTKDLLIKTSLLELKWVIKKDIFWSYELV